MSFICQVCNKSSPAKTRCNTVVTKRRLHQHPHRAYANRIKNEDGKWDFLPDEGGKGYQTVQEIRVCCKCVGSFKPKLLGDES